MTNHTFEVVFIGNGDMYALGSFLGFCVFMLLGNIYLVYVSTSGKFEKITVIL